MKTKNIIAIILLLINVITFHSCKIDSCKETKCGVGTCTNGLCKCPNGYSGINCQINSLDAIIGTYNLQGYYNGYNYNSLSSISFVNNDVNQTQITNIFGYNKPNGNNMIATGVMTNLNTINFDLQPLYSGCDTSFQGSFNLTNKNPYAWNGSFYKYYLGNYIGTQTIQLSK